MNIKKKPIWKMGMAFRNKLLSSPIRRRLAHGAVWGGVAAAGSRVLTIAASFFLARILGQVGFGEYGMVVSTVGMGGSLAGLGIGMTVTKHVAEFRNTDPDKVGRILALSSMINMVSAVVFGIAFVILAPWLAEKTLAAPHLAPLLQISAITVAMGVINGMQTSSLDGCEAFRAKSYISVGTGIVQTLLIVLGAWGWGLRGTVIAMAMGMLLTVAVTRWVMSREWRRFNIRLQWNEAREEWRVLVHFSLPAFLTILFSGWPIYWACNVFLANQPNGYAELGIFSAGTQWQGAMYFLPMLMGTAMIPVMSGKIGTGDVQGSLRVMWRMMRLVALVVAPLAVVLSLLSPLIMSVYGPSFADRYWTMVLLVATGALSAILAPISNFFLANRMVWIGLALNIGWLVTILSSSWSLVGFGSDGLAGARLLAQIVQLTLYVYFIKQFQLKLKTHYNNASVR